MTVYTRFIATANRLIDKYGMQVTWSKDVLTPVDVTKPWLGSTNVPTDYTPTIAFIPANGNMYGMEKYRSQIQAGELSLFGLMAPQEFEPELSDTLVRDGDTQVIKWIDEIKPADETVLYIVGIA